MREIRQQLENELKKIQQVIDTSSLADLRQRVQTAIIDAKTSIDEHLNRFEQANQVADQFVDQHLEEAARSKWSAVIVAAGALIAVAVGVVVGMHL